MVKRFKVVKENYPMIAETTIIGNDVLITITGGDTPHIGTITAFSKDGGKKTTRFPSHHGRFHKDDVLADFLFAEIKEKLPGNCVITAGVHVNHISNAQIQASSAMAKSLGRQIADWFDTFTFEQAAPIYYTNQEKPK
ncbi:hypothetical protein D920_01763 [Enterococcus faecalis 13-SD-W-01]|nr:hypothetical protein D920_01763 [Enterococcus faecalis 13-SD-W-01]